MAVSYPHPLPTDNILPVIDDTRAVKRPHELRIIARGAKILEAVFAWAWSAQMVGKTEQRVAQDIARIMKREGAEALAFPVIAASGAGSADIHHWPTKRKIRKGDILMIDCGAVIGGYCSDCTRTYFLGNPSARFVRYYREVLRAQEKAIHKVNAGVKAGAVDRAARAHLAKWRWGRTFKHGCGHGVGMQIHELPNLKPKSADVLKANSVITVEPGIYMKGWGGIRIEDMVLVQKKGNIVLTKNIQKSLDDIIVPA